MFKQMMLKLLKEDLLSRLPTDLNIEQEVNLIRAKKSKLSASQRVYVMMLYNECAKEISEFDISEKSK